MKIPHMIKMKPCPICAKTDKLATEITKLEFNPNIQSYSFKAIALCHRCGLIMSKKTTFDKSEYSRRDNLREMALNSVIETWNTRGEITCTLDRIKNGDDFICSNCKTHLSDYGSNIVSLWRDYMSFDSFTKPFDYAPCCGAKISQTKKIKVDPESARSYSEHIGPIGDNEVDKLNELLVDIQDKDKK